MRKYILFASFLLICLSIQAQTTVFVSSTATDDTGDGSTWETAKQTIPAALAEAGSNGTVFVKAGSYDITEELMIPAGVGERWLPAKFCRERYHTAPTSWCEFALDR